MKKGWLEKKLGEVCVVERGSSPRPIKNFVTEDDDGVNWVKIGDVNEADKFVRSTRQKITKEGAKKSRFVDVGDFILSNSMSFGRPYIMAIQGYIHDGWFVLRLPNDINSDYFWQLLTSPYLKNQFNDLAAGAIVKNISGDLVKKANIPIPPLSEQEEIVEVLDKAFAAIDQAKANIEQNIANAKELFQSKLNQIFSQKGEGWVEMTLTEISKVQTGKHDANHASDAGEYRFYTCAFDHLLCDTKRFSGPCIILPGNGANVGEVFYYDGEFDAYQRTYVINSIEISPDYLFFHLKALWRERNLNKQYGSATNFLKIGNFKDYVVSYPTNANEQMHIVRICADLSDQLESIASHYQTKLASLDELKKSILQKAFAGELT